MFEWECPHCHRKFYSACPERDKNNIDCCYCHQELANPYAVNEKNEE